MAVSTMSISEDPYESLNSPDLNVYSTVGVTSHNSSGANSRVKSRKSSHPFRLAAVGLGLLCAILLTATITLCVLYMRERGLEMLNAQNCKDYKGQLQRDNISLSNEKNQLQQNCTSLCNEKDQLQRDYNRLSNENNQLQGDYNRLSNEKNQLQSDYNSLNKDKDQLQRNYNQLQENCTSLSNEKDHLRRDYDRLSNERNQLQRDYNSHIGQCTCPEGWEQLSSKCYFFSYWTNRKNWEDSRQYCKLQGAELVIINSQEEQEFIIRHTKNTYYWIGLKVSANGRFEWVDGTVLQQAFWYHGSPTSQGHCVTTGSMQRLWTNEPCNESWGLICETDESCVCNKKLSK